MGSKSSPDPLPSRTLVLDLSNYAIEDLQQLEAAGLPLPACNQIEVNPLLFRHQTIDYCHNRGIVVQA